MWRADRFIRQSNHTIPIRGEKTCYETSLVFAIDESYLDKYGYDMTDLFKLMLK